MLLRSVLVLELITREQLDWDYRVDRGRRALRAKRLKLHTLLGAGR